MKVYIVTRGSYSDYHIEAVFLSKEKAEYYVKYNSGSYYDTPYIEEYDTEDENYDVSKEGYVKAFICFEHYYNPKNYYKYEISESGTSVHFTEYKGDSITRIEPWGNKGIQITIERYFIENKEYGKDLSFYEDRIHKIAHDLIAEINNYLTEGCSYKDIVKIYANEEAVNND